MSRIFSTAGRFFSTAACLRFLGTTFFNLRKWGFGSPECDGLVCLCAKRKVGEFSVFTVYVFSVLLRVSPSAPVCQPVPVVSRVHTFPPGCNLIGPCFPRRSSPFVLQLSHLLFPLCNVLLQVPIRMRYLPAVCFLAGGFLARPFPTRFPFPFVRPISGLESRPRSSFLESSLSLWRLTDLSFTSLELDILLEFTFTWLEYEIRS